MGAGLLTSMAIPRHHDGLQDLWRVAGTGHGGYGYRSQSQ